ncbi:hypothetical protein ABK040_008163 [Willaertia magna]
MSKSIPNVNNGATTSLTSSQSSMSDGSGDVLVLGLTNTGKSYLIKQIKSYIQNKTFLSSYSGLPTNGVNLEELSIQINKKKVRKIKIREIGGSLLLSWHRYYEDCKILIYVIDSSNSLQMSASCIELLNLLSKLKDSKQFLIILNKKDSPKTFSTEIFKHLIRWKELKETVPSLEIMESSAFKGDGIIEIIDFLLKTTSTI